MHFSDAEIPIVQQEGAPLSQLRFNPKGAPRKDLGDVLKPLLDPNLDA